MPKTLFWFILVLSLVRISQQQFSQRQLKAFRSSSKIGSLQTSARKLSNSITLLMGEAEREYKNSTIRDRNVIVSTINDAISEVVDIISEAQENVDSTKNSAGKMCVIAAQTSIGLKVNAGVKVTYECSVRTSIRLFNLATRVASLDVGPKSRLSSAAFGRVSNCPPSFLVESQEDLKSARACYTDAEKELTNYIETTTKAYEELRATLDVLKQNGKECILNGSAIALKGAESVVETLLSCARAVKVYIMPADIRQAIKDGVSKIEEFVSNSKASVLLTALSVNSSLVSINQLREGIATDVEDAMNDTLRQIATIEKITKTNNEGTCISDAKTRYYNILETDISYSKNCIAATIKILSASTLLIVERRLNILLKNASEKAVAKCNAPEIPVITAASVTTCFDDFLSDLKRLVKPVLQVSEFTLKSTEILVSSAQRCVQDRVNHASLGGKGVINMLATCMLRNGLQFVLSQKY